MAIKYEGTDLGTKKTFKEIDLGMKKTLPARQLFKTWRRRRQRRVNLCEILCDNRDHRDNHGHRINRDDRLWAENYFLLDVVQAENEVESADEEEEEKQDQGGEEQAWPRLAISPPENMNYQFLA